MTAHQIISLIRREGDIRLGPGDCVQVKKCARELKQLVRENELTVRYYLKEERASRRWEASGRNPGWWKDTDFNPGERFDRGLNPFSYKRADRDCAVCGRQTQHTTLVTRPGAWFCTECSHVDGDPVVTLTDEELNRRFKNLVGRFNLKPVTVTRIREITGGPSRRILNREPHSTKNGISP